MNTRMTLDSQPDGMLASFAQEILYAMRFRTKVDMEALTKALGETTLTLPADYEKLILPSCEGTLLEAFGLELAQFALPWAGFSRRGLDRSPHCMWQVF